MRWFGGRDGLSSLGWLLHLAGALLALALLMSGWIADRALLRRLQTLDTSQRFAVRLASRADSIHARHRAAQQALAAAGEKLAGLRARLPAQADETVFLRQLAGLSAAVGVQIDDFRPQRSIPQPPHNRLGLQLSGRGPYGSVCRFLAGLEQLPRLAWVRSLTITAPPSDGDACTLVAELDLFFTPGATSPAGEEVR